MTGGQTTAASPVGLEPRLVQFVRLLRDNAFSVGTKDVSDTLKVLDVKSALREYDFRKTLKIILCSNQDELLRFDTLFDAYWNDRVGRKRTLEQNAAGGVKSSQFPKHQASQGNVPSGLANYFEWRDTQNDDADAPDDDVEHGENRLGGASTLASIATLDAGKIDNPDDYEKLLAFADKLARQMRYRLGRRFRPDAKGATADLRRVLRSAMHTGGLPLILPRKAKKRPPVSLLTFIDVSGSMDAYSLFFARFAFALSGGFLHAETFLFHTSLAHVSQVFKEANPMKMMEKLALISQGWSGGTRIGDALETFNARYARKYTGGRTVALILSDGYDTGEPEKLAKQLRILKSRCYRVIWLNPMLGRDGYTVETNAMQQALPLIDVFAAAHNLRSLMELEKHLAGA